MTLILLGLGHDSQLAKLFSFPNYANITNNITLPSALISDSQAHDIESTTFIYKWWCKAKNIIHQICNNNQYTNNVITSFSS